MPTSQRTSTDPRPADRGAPRPAGTGRLPARSADPSGARGVRAPPGCPRTLPSSSPRATGLARMSENTADCSTRRPSTNATRSSMVSTALPPHLTVVVAPATSAQLRFRAGRRRMIRRASARRCPPGAPGGPCRARCRLAGTPGWHIDSRGVAATSDPVNHDALPAEAGSANLEPIDRAIVDRGQDNKTVPCGCRRHFDPPLILQHDSNGD